MDEPTTHLDLSSIDALAFALDQFRGTLIFISHDVYFIRALANHVVHVNAGQLTHYAGGYDYYVEKTKAQSARAALTASTSSNSEENRASRQLTAATSRKDQKRLEAEQRQARSRERRAQQQIVDDLEREIQQLEAHQAELVASLEKSETYEKPGAAAELNRELLHVQKRLSELNPRWEQAATRLAHLE
jgi:ATP-binding cassette subfamily F protein 3